MNPRGIAGPRSATGPRGIANPRGVANPRNTGNPRGTVVALAAAAIASLASCVSFPAGEGEVLFADRCAGCHTPAGTARVAGPALLAQLSPRAIVAALEDGVMRVEGAGMDAEQRIAVAEYLTRRRYAAEAIPQAAFCADAVWTGLDPAAVSWMGFAGNLAGTGYQPPERAGLDASDIPNLHLKWAFAFPDGSQMRTSPTVVGDAALVAGPFGEVVALDLATGCARWSFEAEAAVRGAIAVGLDGVIRAHSTADGAVIWEYDTTRPVETVGGVPGEGGAIDGPGPVVAGGMLFVNSGYALFSQMPGNVLLAFGVEDPAGTGN